MGENHRLLSVGINPMVAKAQLDALVMGPSANREFA